ncbi:MAG: methyltransferase domain-containing protein [Pseudomonadota bacterium]|nr:methyltransferase domain-containing protein [Pseudomonadota bacterium]
MNFGAIGNLTHRLMLARTLPPRLVLAKIAKRLPWTDRKTVRVAEIVNSPRDLQPDRLIRYFLDQEALLRERNGRDPIEFAGKKVIEVGPGPLAGYGPMAIFRGAERVYSIDPDWIDGVFADAAVKDAYLRPHHAALSEAFGSLMSLEEFCTRLSKRLTVVAVGIEAAKPRFKADVVISNSCLEHIDGLETALTVLADLTATQARFMHLVNFGNHRNRASPFETIYEMQPVEYCRLYGAHINLLRPSDVGRCFEAAGIQAEMTTVDRSTKSVEELELNSYWRERYTFNELAIRTALFCEPQRCGVE